MYTQQDIDDLTRQLRRQTALWLIPETILLAGVILCFVRRVEWLTSLLFATLCSLILFSLSLRILPLRRYRAFVHNALHGKTTRTVALFDAMQTQTAWREGVRVYPFTLRVPSVKEELDERQFYWDANLPRPDWRPGDRILLRSHERLAVSWEKAGADMPLEG